MNKTTFRMRLVAEGGVLVAVLAWWWLSTQFPAYVLPGPIAVLSRSYELLTTGRFLDDIVTTTLRVSVSILLAMVLGTIIALIPRYVPAMRSTVNERIRPFFNSFPAIGWVLLATTWFNVSNFTVIFVQVAILLPLCLINVGAGVRAIDAELIEMGRSFSRSGLRVFFRIVLPLLTPYLLAALRISYGVAWKIGLVSELFGASSGMGFALLRAQTYADTAGMLSICLMIVFLFVFFDLVLIRPIERRFRHVSV